MPVTVTKADIWSCEISDQPGGLAAKLEALAEAGADLSFVIARRQPDKLGKGIVFLSGLKGAKQTKAAQAAGVTKSTTLAALRVEGTNKPGAAHEVVQAVAEAGVNLRGLAATTIGRKWAAKLAFDSAADADAAARAIKKLK
jgi:hypothetical protein